MKMGLEFLTNMFAGDRNIELYEAKIGSLIGDKQPLRILYRDNNHGQSMMILRRFAGSDEVNESSVFVKYDNHDNTLNLRVLEGCLPDYIAMLSNTEDEFSKMLKETLIEVEKNSRKNPHPESTVKVKIEGPSTKEIFRLLNNFYPCN